MRNDDTPGPCVRVFGPLRCACCILLLAGDIVILLRWSWPVYSSIEQHIKHIIPASACHVLQGYEHVQVRPDSIICYHTGRSSVSRW